MNDKQSRLLLGLAVALIALVALVTLVEPTKVEGEPESRTWTAIEKDLKADQIDKLELQKGEVRATFARTEDGWAMTSPKAVAADGRRLDEIADAFARIELADDLGADKLSGYGLDPAKMTVTATLKDGRTLSIAVGDDAPVGWQSYVKDGAGHARLSRARLSDTFGVDPLDLRSREMLRFSESAVTRLVLEIGPQRFDLEEDDHGWWVTAAGPVVSPRTRADESRIERSLNALRDLRAESLPSSPIPLPAVERLIRLTEGSTTLELQLGPLADGQRLAVAPLQEGAVPVRSSVLDSDLRDTIEHWLSTRLIPVRPVTVDAVEVKLGAQTLEGKRTENGWSEPKAEATLSALVAVRLNRNRPAPEPAGEPWGQIVLREGTTRLEAVDLFQVTPEGDRVARDRAGGPAFLLAQSEIQRILDGMAGITQANPDEPARPPSGMQGLEGLDLDMLGGALPPGFGAPE